MAAALEDALAYSQQRDSVGKPIWKHQAGGNYLADMATKLPPDNSPGYVADRYESVDRCDGGRYDRTLRVLVARGGI